MQQAGIGWLVLGCLALGWLALSLVELHLGMGATPWNQLCLCLSRLC